MVEGVFTRDGMVRLCYFIFWQTAECDRKKILGTVTENNMVNAGVTFSNNHGIPSTFQPLFGILVKEIVVSRNYHTK